MMRICMLASGSKGNSVYLETPRARVLLDAGLSARELTRRLKLIGRSPADLDAVVISHEHIDHIRGAGVLSRSSDVTICISGPTLARAPSSVGKIGRVRTIEAGVPFAVGDLQIAPFEVTHDAANPLNFVLRCDGVKMAVATDLGYASNLVRENLKECRLLILETNHDPKMLEEGPYPWSLKQRIRSRNGHLSNEQGAELLAAVMHDGLEHVFLAHLSEQNNLPGHAVAAVKKALGPRLNGCTLHVGSQDNIGKMITIAPD